MKDKKNLLIVSDVSPCCSTTLPNLFFRFKIMIPFLLIISVINVASREVPITPLWAAVGPAVGQKTYYYHTVASTWTVARNACWGQGYEFATIDSVEEQTFLKNSKTNINFEQGYQYWISGADAMDRNQFCWDAAPTDTCTTVPDVGQAWNIPTVPRTCLLYTTSFNSDTLNGRWQAESCLFNGAPTLCQVVAAADPSTTEEPTTEVPTTEEPTTEEPTTEEPTTEEPTTEEPTTEEPTTEVPTTEEPTTEVPTTEEPTTEESTTEEPTTEESTTEEPTTEEPTTEEPTTEEPTTEEPTTEEPTTEVPTTEEPTTTEDTGGLAELNPMLVSLGRIEGKTFYYHDAIMSWTAARAYCVSLGATYKLASIGTSAQQEYLKSKTDDAGFLAGSYYWINARDSRMLSQYKWDGVNEITDVGQGDGMAHKNPAISCVLYTSSLGPNINGRWESTRCIDAVFRVLCESTP